MLDGQQLFDGNFTPESSPVNVTLASGTGLSNEQHTVVLTNTGGEPIDIDTITFEPQIGSTGYVQLLVGNSSLHKHDRNFNVTRIDDTDSRIQYLPQSAWNVNSRPEFQDGTLQYVLYLDSVILIDIVKFLPGTRCQCFTPVYGKCHCILWYSFTRPC